MQLISQLQEAADVPLKDLKALVKKDKRVNKVFSKNLQLDELDDPAEFVRTLRFYVLNNRNVLAFVKDSGSARRVSSFWFRSAREIRPETLTQKSLDDIVENVQDFFKDLTAAQNGTVSTSTYKDLWQLLDREYVTLNARHNMSNSERREWLATPEFRPTTPVTLYMGLHFNEGNFKEKQDYNGNMEVGQGLQFLRSVREGKRVVDLKLSGLSIWTTSLEEARNYAFNGSESSYRKEQDKIRSQMAFVISTLMKPSNIIVDTARLPVPHSEPKVIVAEGDYTCRIINKYTPKGEVDPTAGVDDNSAAVDTAESITTFAHVWKPPLTRPKFGTLDRGSFDLASFNLMRDPDTKPKILKSMENLRRYYLEHLHSADSDGLAELSGTNHHDAAELIAGLQKFFGERQEHPTELDPSRGRARKKLYKRHELTSEEVYDNYKSASIDGILPFLVDKKRFTSWSTASPLIALLHLASIPVPKDVHLSAGKVQQEWLSKAVTGFFNVIGEPEPADRKEAAKKIHDMVALAERNANMLDKLWDFRDDLDRLKD